MNVQVEHCARPQGKSVEMRAAEHERTGQIGEAAGTLGGAGIEQARVFIGRSVVVQSPPECAANRVGRSPRAER
jgi:hypothetical protein